MLISCGGYDGRSLLKTCDMLRVASSTSSDTWSPLPQLRLPSGLAGHSLTTTSANGLLALVGGYEGGTRTDKTYYTNTDLTMWSPGPTLTRGRSSHCAVAVARDSDAVIVTGGWHDSDTTLDSVELLDFSSNTVQSLSPMTGARAGHGCATISTHNDDQLVVVAGGYCRGCGGYLSSCEMMSLSTGRWTPLPSLPTGRGYTTLVPVSQDTVRLIGGKSCFDCFESEILDLTIVGATDGWTPVNGVTVSRYSHTAVEIPSC